MGFSRQEYWSGLSFSPSGDLPHPGTKPCISCLGRRHCQILETALCSGKIPALSPCEDPTRHQERGSVSQLVRGMASFTYRENWVRFRLDGSKRNSVMRQKPAGAPGSPGSHPGCATCCSMTLSKSLYNLHLCLYFKTRTWYVVCL